MTRAVTPAAEIPPLGHDEAMRVAAVECQRLLDVVDRLQPADWSRATDCAGWDVRAVVAHLLGMLEHGATTGEEARQSKLAATVAAERGVLWIDALTELQVREHAGLSNADLAAALHATVPAALAARLASTPQERARLFRPGLPGETEWTRGYLLDVIQTRDSWMHRVDVCRSVGRELVLTAEHDGRIVADVVADWARRHGRPFVLVLDGPAGGVYTAGRGGERHHRDAVEFCRILSGRAKGRGLLEVPVPF